MNKVSLNIEIKKYSIILKEIYLILIIWMKIIFIINAYLIIINAFISLNFFYFKIKIMEFYYLI